MPWQVDSETGVLRDVLLCPPTYYEWIPSNAVAVHTLRAGTRLDRDALGQQFDGLVAALIDAGVTPHKLRPDPCLPYQAYTRDSSQTTPWGVLLTQMEKPQRRGEVGEIARFYGGDFWQCATAGSLEGGDIHIIRPGLAVIGWSDVRTTRPGAEQLAAWLRAEAWQVRLQNFAAHFLHLDVLFCMVTDTLALACTEVLGDEFAAFCAANGITLIEATYREVMQMSCNVLALGNNRVISPAHSTRLNGLLRARGVSVIDPPLDMFAQGGGSVHCMTMPLRRDPL